MGLRLGFDVGGTFTDLALLDEESGRLGVGKTLTTPDDPSVGVMRGMADLLGAAGRALAEVSQAIHGTTLASNLIIERKGARTGLLTTEGFRDVLHLQRQLRYTIYDLFLDKPRPLLPRHLIQEVRERTLFDGTIHLPLDEASVRRGVERLLRAGVTSFAVCLLHAYANPGHERRVGAIVREMAPGAFVSLSSTIAPQWREYERTNTTVANAYIAPLARGHLDALDARMRAQGFRHPLYIMQSNGGIASASMMAEQPIRMIESGPAAGALMAAHYGALTGMPDLLSFDMGGTTAKVCLIEGGRPRTTNDFEIDKTKLRAGSGLPINVPAIELIEIGAGGGSIARIDHNLLRVGPDSAGAAPGPICYGLGGTQPTVTDANVVLGYIDPDYFLGGRMQLDAEAARRGIAERIGRPLGLGDAQAAWGIHELVTQAMVQAMRVVSVERGKDPRRFCLIAFGGAGPIHGCRLARSLGLPRVLLPAAAGVTSALGLLVADVQFDLAQTFSTLLGPGMLPRVNQLYRDLERRGSELLREAGAGGAGVLTRSADMHYRGQGHDIGVPLPGGAWTEAEVGTIRAAFEQAYAAVFGYSDPDQQVEVTRWKLTAASRARKFELPRSASRGDLAQARKGNRPVYFKEAGAFTPCPVYDRYRLPVAAGLDGPAVIEERESTTVLLPGDRATVDAFGTLVVDISPSP
jgi:N-methylhydantoinase A/oxoprolinase/acetone carboxylase beta subunit